MRMKPARSLQEVASTALDMLLLRYPAFVYGRGIRDGAIPVFCFHGVEPGLFGAMLEFLGSNGYRTLDADEYYAALTGRTAVSPRAVVLTFDDGWGSLWTVGFPLLKRYGMKVVIFLAAGRIERGERGPTLDGLKFGAGQDTEVLHRDDSACPLLTWEEILEMHGSGLVDFQSHSASHSLICRSPRIVDFANPELLRACSFLELPCPPDAGQARPEIRLGEPLYESAPRLSDIPGVWVDPHVADGCAAFVEERGGPDFFRSRRWRAQLERAAARLLADSSWGWRVETPEEQVEAVRFEMMASRQLIEEKLPGKAVRHLCYPWHEAGELAVAESRRAGYVTNFWGKVKGRYLTSIPGDPFGIARLGGDFFLRLPGRGRAGLLRILLGKTARRIREGSPYLAH